MGGRLPDCLVAVRHLAPSSLALEFPDDTGADTGAKEIDPYFDPAWYQHNLGLAHMILRSYEKALEEFERSSVRPYRVAAYMAGWGRRVAPARSPANAWKRSPTSRSAAGSPRNRSRTRPIARIWPNAGAQPGSRNDFDHLAQRRQIKEISSTATSYL
jgi:hypothetical protein